MERSKNQKSTVKLFNSYGVLVYQNEINSEISLSIDISSFSDGLYLARIENKEGRSVKKFIKE
ncbi:MAG: T9SS type A sorting domain-containing protein [Bacteroidetes bacterium]|nr:T9SS type A sorting domain-containing protein [Bacteroidota bacterium]